jgi:hypothetical protein
MANAPDREPAWAVLLGGPYAGQEVKLAGNTLVVGLHLHELTAGRAESGRRSLPVYRHRDDCCGPAGGADDSCE